MGDILTAPHSSTRAVRWWLVCIAALIALMVLVGGATRAFFRSLLIDE